MRRVSLLAAVLTVGLAWIAGGQAASPPEKTASQAYKNVQVLKDVSAKDWIPTMQFISGSLGVSCEFCHTIGKFDVDSKDTKRKARDMMNMVMAINRNSFNGELTVTCNTCHRGLTRPNAVPETWNKTSAQLAAYQQELQTVLDREKGAAPSPAPPSTIATSYPAASEVLARYRLAVGADKLNSWKTLRVAGTAAAQAAKGVFNFAVYFVLPDNMLIGDSVPGARPRIVLSGDRAWAVTPQARTLLPPDQVETVRTRALLFLPVKVTESPSMRTTGIEHLGDRSLYVVESRTPKVVTRAYFDTASGLLYKTRDETDTPLGIMVIETLFEDYRAVDGITLPFSITGLFMEDRIQYTLTEARKNAFIDPSLFVPPPG